MLKSDREDYDNYYYIQVSKDISNPETEEREYSPFYMIKDLYLRYLFTPDLLLQKRDGINHLNIVYVFLIKLYIFSALKKPNRVITQFGFFKLHFLLVTTVKFFMLLNQINRNYGG